MEFNDIRIGMSCGSKKGSGVVTWIDGSTRAIYMSDTKNENNFEVYIEDIIEDPQAHNRDDTYYQFINPLRYSVDFLKHLHGAFLWLTLIMI